MCNIQGVDVHWYIDMYILHIKTRTLFETSQMLHTLGIPDAKRRTENKWRIEQKKKKRR